MRKLITAMKISLDGKFEGPQGYADWVSAWSDDYGLTPGSTRACSAAGCTPATSSTGRRSRTTRTRSTR